MSLSVEEKMEAVMPDAGCVRAVTRLPLRNREGLSLLLDVFENVEGLRPTHWGPDERARNPYDRDQMISVVSSLTDDYRVPGLRRSKPPRYQAYFSANNEHVNDITVDFSAPSRVNDLRQFFELGATLAQAVTPEYAFVHLIWRLGERSQEYSASGIINAAELQACGPKAPPISTWYGPHLVHLIGRERLLTCGAHVQETSWGGIHLELVERPWESDFETVSTRQNEVMKHLEPSGIFGDYSNPLRCSPGARWQPMEESESV